jgi:hypothetical protein
MRFSHKMSLEEGWAMLGIERQSAQWTRIEPGGDPGVFEGQR